MSVLEKKPNNSSYDQKCKLLLKEPNVRFAGVIDKMGNFISGGFNEGIKPLEDETEMRKMFMEVALRVATRSEFDQSLGEDLWLNRQFCARHAHVRKGPRYLIYS